MELKSIDSYKHHDHLMPETISVAEESPLSSGERRALEKRLALAELKVAVLESNCHCQ